MYYVIRNIQNASNRKIVSIALTIAIHKRPLKQYCIQTDINQIAENLSLTINAWF